MGSVCNFGVENNNQYESNFDEEYEKYNHVKKISVDNL